MSNATDVTSAAPVAESERIETLDVIRGFALLGILLMNIVGMGMLSAAYSHPLVGAGGAPATALDLQVWFLAELFGEGAMRALFSMLFGAGVVLFATGARAKSAALHYKRTFWLLIFGIVDAFVLLWSGDILMVYAMCGAVLYGVPNASSARLFTVATVLLTLMCSFHWSIEYAFEDSRAAAELAVIEKNGGSDSAETSALAQRASTWLDFKADATPSPERIEAELSQRQGSYLSAFTWNRQEVIELLVFAVPTVLFWDALTMMLFGMALYKIGVLPGARAKPFYRNLMLAGLGFGIAINYWETSNIQALEYDTIATFGFSHFTYDLGRMGLALGYIGLLGWVVANGWLPAARRRLAAVGRMALTNYLMHSLIALILFTGAGFALVGELQRWQLYPIVFAVWGFQLWFSPWWLLRHSMGPLEALWRRLTYGAKRSDSAFEA